MAITVLGVCYVRFSPNTTWLNPRHSLDDSPPNIRRSWVDWRPAVRIVNAGDCRHGGLPKRGLPR
jgi:hypothetical protein